MYDDGLVIISPSAKELQRLLDICAVYGQTHDILFNDDNTVDMYMPANSSFYINTPAVFLKGRRLSFTVKYKYLGTLMTHDGSDEAFMSRQKGFFMRAAMVYPNISTHVRLRLWQLHSSEPSVVICIVATFGMILGNFIAIAVRAASLSLIVYQVLCRCDVNIYIWFYTAPNRLAKFENAKRVE